MIIIGAGMAGLLAANMLRHREPIVYEKQSALPNNHSAVLRFRSTIIGDTLNIPFKKVKMLKAPLPWKNPVADAMAYSFKNTGTFRSDRSITEGIVSEDRYIAPNDLIQRMAKNVTVEFSYDVPGNQWNEIVISTIPMPALMQLLGYERKIEFKFMPGINVRATIRNCDAYVSVLVPDPDFDFSRISITGNELIIEFPNLREFDDEEYLQEITDDALKLIGMSFDDLASPPLVKKQAYAKISPIDDDERRNFIHWASSQHNIYSLGRFACWRPGLLLDDLVQDVRKIDRWSSGSKYEMVRER